MAEDEKTIKNTMELVALQRLVANVTAWVYDLAHLSPEDVSQLHATWREKAHLETFPGVDAARSSLYASAYADALGDLLSAVEQARAER